VDQLGRSARCRFGEVFGFDERSSVAAARCVDGRPEARRAPADDQHVEKIAELRQRRVAIHATSRLAPTAMPETRDRRGSVAICTVVLLSEQEKSAALQPIKKNRSAPRIERLPSGSNKTLPR